MKLLRGLARRRRIGRGISFPGLDGVDSFRAVVEHERNCVCRNGHTIALVVFDVDAHEGTDRSGALCTAACTRIRSTDRAGVMSDGRVAVLLTYTARPGATLVANDIVAGVDPQPAFEIFIFPDDTDPGDRGRHGRAHEAPIVTTTRPSVPAAAPRMLMGRTHPIWKRGIDIVGAATALTLFSPLMVGAAIAIKLTSSGPIFFRQKRAGLGGRPFSCIKFRTMITDAERRRASLLSRNEQTGPVFKLRDDPRITRVGRILRKTSIDEMPQLWNVLRGDMSLVGPRPLPCQESQSCSTWQQRRLDVMPGLTGIWQVSGRCEIPFEAWCRMDIRYVESLSLGGDLKILALTVPAVISGRGAC